MERSCLSAVEATREEVRTPSHDSSRRWLLLIILFALVFRLWNIDYPDWKSVDEQDTIDRALLLGHRGLNPGWFIYPSLFYYVLFAIDGIVYVLGSLIGFFSSPEDFARFYFAHPLVLHLVGRGITLACGLACLVVTFGIGREGWGVGVGLAATGLLAISPVYLLASREVKPDILMTLLLLLAAWAILRYLDTDRAMWLWSASVLIGLAASAKYPAAMGVLWLVVAPWISRRGPTVIAKSALALSLAGVGFVAGTPFAVLDWSSFHAFLNELASYMNRSWYGGEDQPIGYLVYLFQVLPWALGWPAALLGLAGLARWLFWGRSRERLLAGFVVALYAWMGYSRIVRPHYLLPLYPFLALAGADLARAAIVRLWSVRPVVSRVMLGSMMVVCLLPPFALSVRETLLLNARDTRELAGAWIAEHLPSGTRILSEPYGPFIPLAGGRVEEIIGEEQRRRSGHGMRLQFEREHAKPGEGFWYYEMRLYSDRFRSRPASEEYDLDKFLSQGYKVIVLSSAVYDRYRRIPEQYPLQGVFFNRVVRSGVLLARFTPSTPWCCPETLNARLSEAMAMVWGHPGPTLLIYRLPDKS